MIYIEKKAKGGYFNRLFDRENIHYTYVDSADDFEDTKGNIYITSQKNRFVHNCPGTREYRCCGYMVADAVEGCPFDCTYCILQVYLNHNYIKVYDDLEGIKQSILSLPKEKVRLGTGELSDSLALDHILKLSDFIIPVINSLEHIQFEFKTKSTNIKNLLNHNPKNIVISFSLNPENVAVKEELFAASPLSRIKAAQLLAAYGYRLAFHFDPLIYTDNFEKDYMHLIDILFDHIEETSVEFVSISTFRFIPELADIIRQKFDSNLLANNFTRALDGKMRYFKSQRFYMLMTIYNYISSCWKKPFIYFCMEDYQIWQKIAGFDPGERDNFEKHFHWYKI